MRVMPLVLLALLASPARQLPPPPSPPQAGVQPSREMRARGQKGTAVIRGRVFAADWGFVTLTMSISSLIAGVLADHFGATTATITTASLSVLWAIFWGAWTWRLWR